MTLSSDGPERPPALLTAKLLAQQEALAFMAANMRARFANFDNDLIKRYIDLQRAAQSSVKEAETETTRFRKPSKPHTWPGSSRR